jgi:hypothetical protein
LSRAEGEVRANVLEAIKQIESVEPSPLFSFSRSLLQSTK